MKGSNDYVTKQDLREELEKTTAKIVEKIVDEMSEVIQDGFALATTKKDLQDTEERLQKKMDKGFDNVEKRLDRLELASSSQDERFGKVERTLPKHAKRIATLEEHAGHRTP